MTRLAARVAVLFVFFAACEDDVRTERELFLKRIHDYASAPEGDKAASLEALRRLSPRSPAVREAHGECLAAYAGIERAEAEHGRAKALLREIDAGERTFEGAEADIRRAIESSDSAARGARGAIDRCMRLVDGLRLGRERN